MSSKTCEMKECCNCKRVLDVNNYHKSSKSRDGFSSRCRSCESDRKKVAKEKDPELALRKREQHKVWYRKNKEYKDLQNKTWREENKSKFRSSNLKRRFGITHEQFEDILKTQDNKCAICGVDQDVCGKYLCIDHDHETGKIRGLLCDLCNRALGQFQDNLEVLKKAVEYKEKHS